MKNPTDRDVIARNAIMASTGITALRNGATGFQALNIGSLWGWWYKNMTASVVLLFVTLFYAWGNKHEYQHVFFVAQVVINAVVCGVTYCKLVDVSGFKQRRFYRLWWPVARLFRNTARIWFYLAAYLPLWALMWYQCSITDVPNW